MENSNENAFPLEGVSDGLTKREYFAGLAMQSLGKFWADDMRCFDEWAKRSVIVADMLLLELSKEPND